MCDVMPTISEDSISQRSSQFSGEDANFEQLMVSMLDERDKLMDSLRETQDRLGETEMKLAEVVKERDSLQRQINANLPQVGVILIWIFCLWGVFTPFSLRVVLFRNWGCFLVPPRWPSHDGNDFNGSITPPLHSTQRRRIRAIVNCITIHPHIYIYIIEDLHQILFLLFLKIPFKYPLGFFFINRMKVV